MKLRIIPTCLLFLLLLTAARPYAGIIYVRQDGSGDTSLILGGIIHAGPGDTVYVGPGLYYEESLSIRQSIHIISEAGPEVTTIYHRGTPAEQRSCVFYVRVDNVSIIGFTIRGGHSMQGFRNGGGFHIWGSNILIENNIITNNKSGYGGAFFCLGGGPQIIRNNLITQNEATIGGAFNIRNSEPIIEGNTIAENRANIGASAMRVMGEGVRPVIRHNIICNNYCKNGLSNVIEYNANPDDLIFECNNVWSDTVPGSLYYGLLTDQTGINGNISTDPLFCGERGSGNFYLRSDSPCAEEHVPEWCSGIRMGRYPVNCVTATDNSTWGGIKKLNLDEK